MIMADYIYTRQSRERGEGGREGKGERGGGRGEGESGGGREGGGRERGGRDKGSRKRIGKEEKDLKILEHVISYTIQ